MSPQTNNRIYLDYAAATPMDDRVYKAMQPFFTDVFHNPSALYSGAREARNALEEARSTTAQLLGARPSEIIFTAGGTESTNLAIKGVMDTFPGAELIISSVEHDAVYYPAMKYGAKLAAVDENGVADVKDIEKKITDRTVMISVMYVNNEVGTVQPIQDIAQLIKRVRADRAITGNTLPLYLHTDACQAPVYLDCHTARLGVDLLTLNGGKIYGPKQSGILYAKAGVRLSPHIEGGGQEWGYRSGTENVAFAAGFTQALELVSRGRSERQKQVRELRDWFIEETENTLSADLTGHPIKRIANNIHIRFNGCDNERMLFSLDTSGVDAAIGSACSASKETSSRVLAAMGYSDAEAQSSLRFTIDATTTKDELLQVLEYLSKAVKA